MTQDLKQIVEKEAERVFPYRSWHTAHNIRTDIDREKFIKGANFALTLNRWVKIEEGLPEQGLPPEFSILVLVTDGTDYEITWYCHDIKQWHTERMNKVTHWQPLPPLP